MQPQTFRVGNGIFLPDITFSNVTCYDPAKNELEHATDIHRTAVLVFHLGILQLTLPILHTYTHLQQEHAGLRLLFADLLCGNWVTCSQNGIVTGEIQWSIFPDCPCLCPERTSQQPWLTSLILCSSLPHHLSPFSCPLSLPAGFNLNAHRVKLFFRQIRILILNFFVVLWPVMLFIQIQEWCAFPNWYETAVESIQIYQVTNPSSSQMNECFSNRNCNAKTYWWLKIFLPQLLVLVKCCRDLLLLTHHSTGKPWFTVVGYSSSFQRWWMRVRSQFLQTTEVVPHEIRKSHSQSLDTQDIDEMWNINTTLNESFGPNFPIQ